VRVDEELAIRRARAVNNKGVVDEFRREKLAYETVKRHFHALRARLASGED
jgi:beta-glucuronidase